MHRPLSPRRSLPSSSSSVVCVARNVCTRQINALENCAASRVSTNSHAHNSLSDSNRAVGLLHMLFAHSSLHVFAIAQWHKFVVVSLTFILPPCLIRLRSEEWLHFMRRSTKANEKRSQKQNKCKITRRERKIIYFYVFELIELPIGRGHCSLWLQEDCILSKNSHKHFENRKLRASEKNHFRGKEKTSKRKWTWNRTKLWILNRFCIRFIISSKTKRKHRIVNAHDSFCLLNFHFGDDERNGKFFQLFFFRWVEKETSN